MAWDTLLEKPALLPINGLCPSYGRIKINLDVIVRQEAIYTEAIARNSNGEICHAWTSRQVYGDSLWVESVAAVQAV